jgi:hypothetical protein
MIERRPTRPTNNSLAKINNTNITTNKMKQKPPPQNQTTQLKFNRNNISPTTAENRTRSKTTTAAA